MKKLKLQDTEDGCQAQSSVCTAVCVYVEQRGSFAVISANPVGTNAFWLCIVFVLRQGEKKGWQSQWTHLPGKQVGWPHSLWPDSHNVRTQCYFKTVKEKKKKKIPRHRSPVFQSSSCSNTSRMALLPSQTWLRGISDCLSHFSALPRGRRLYCREADIHMVGSLRDRAAGVRLCMRFPLLPFCHLSSVLSSLHVSLQDHQFTGNLSLFKK